ncbi:MAG TPA: GntR family transcriptional regulator, partial [Bryobacteraceae bacterium]
MLPIQPLDPHSHIPLYRQLYEALRGSIYSGLLPDGHRLPATRELAGQLGLNRATISSAYELLEKDGLITGHVGRGSFVASRHAVKPGVNWNQLLGSFRQPSTTATGPLANFANSRPSELLFPLEDFRTS